MNNPHILSHGSSLALYFALDQFEWFGYGFLTLLTKTKKESELNRLELDIKIGLLPILHLLITIFSELY